ncbi:ribosome small subunit-dependent GTPase A [Massilia glaciei]|uniref:Small ribosomal subunit biogenesis GTPase RsgA n=1 Tax=Massilia glaciei TaxID=1524097 RepID=A0A2U2I5E7_9BURK|nr:ribosome small subunit-dependent GTPase A [Massilia glaciei]PWF54859.1 ribosome small subunit-dependent GTPase A [Massilia glaciei]
MLDINFESLRLIGLNHSITSQLTTFDHAVPGGRLARVCEVQRDWIGVHDGATALNARPLNRLLRALAAEDAALAVGDWVLLSTDGDDVHWLSARLTPLNHLARRTSEGRRQSLASNVDTALLVMGLDHDFNLRRLERYIALADAAGVAPVAVLTKADIGIDVEARMAQLRRRLGPQVPAFALNTLDGDSARVLAPWLGMGQTLILLGTSGAGKSTLTNALANSAQATGGVRADDSRGRHTTTARSLHRCPGGACIIDTPGLRGWQPDAGEDALAATFDDIAALARQCQFRDCRHQAEPGCAVRGAVDPDRILNYHKLLREVRRTEQTPLERIADRAKWKVLVRQAQSRGRQNRGG